MLGLGKGGGGGGGGGLYAGSLHFRVTTITNRRRLVMVVTRKCKDVGARSLYFLWLFGEEKRQSIKLKDII